MTFSIPETNSQIPYNGLQSVPIAPTKTPLFVFSSFLLFWFWTCYWLVSSPEMSYLKYLPDHSLTSLRSLVQNGHFNDTFLAILSKPELSPNHSPNHSLLPYFTPYVGLLHWLTLSSPKSYVNDITPIISECDCIRDKALKETISLKWDRWCGP